MTDANATPDWVKRSIHTKRVALDPDNPFGLSDVVDPVPGAAASAPVYGRSTDTRRLDAWRAVGKVQRLAGALVTCMHNGTGMVDAIAALRAAVDDAEHATEYLTREG